MSKKRKYKKRLSDKDLVVALIDKQLEPFGVKAKDVCHIEDWYRQFEVTEKENKEWVDWCVDFIVKNAKNSLLRTKKAARKEMIMINLGYGLKISTTIKRTVLIEKVKNQK